MGYRASGSGFVKIRKNVDPIQLESLTNGIEKLCVDSDDTYRLLLSHPYENYYEEDVLGDLEPLIPFAEEIKLVMEGEDGSRWRFRLSNDEIVEDYLITIATEDIPDELRKRGLRFSNEQIDEIVSAVSSLRV